MKEHDSMCERQGYDCLCEDRSALVEERQNQVNSAHEEWFSHLDRLNQYLHAVDLMKLAPVHKRWQAKVQCQDAFQEAMDRWAGRLAS